MSLEQYYTYKDVFGRDISKVETMEKIKYILSKYRKELVLKLLGHIAKKINTGNSLENINNIQIELLNIPVLNYKIIHQRAILALYQFFYEIENYNEKDISEILNPNDVLNLFLLVNHLLDKNEYKSQTIKDGEIPVELLMASIKMSTDFIGNEDIRIQNDLFIEFYEKINGCSEIKNFNKVLIEKTDLTLQEFIEMQKKFRDLNNFEFKVLCNKLEKCAVIKYDQVHNIWKNRIPLLQIPLDYRFLEQYPLIKKEDDYYVTSFLLLKRCIIMKPYHILSEETKNQKPSFRNFFTRSIAEPIIKEKIIKMFECPQLKEIKVCSNDNEFADFAFIEEGNIFLFEIKSVYMGLEIRYTNEVNIFKTEFDKRYILNDSGKHQQINQLLNIENHFDKFIEFTGLDKSQRYKIFCIMLVFDEVLKCIRFNPFNLYIRDEFYKNIKNDIDKFNNIKPYPVNIFITFNEIMILNELIRDPYKKYLVLKNFFSYDKTSLESLIYDLKIGEATIDGINIDDFNS